MICDNPNCSKKADSIIKINGKRMSVCSGRGGHIGWGYKEAKRKRDE